MINCLKPFLQYKHSGVPWVGDVPRHWQVLPNRALFSEVKDRNHPDEEMLSVTIANGIVRQKTLLEGSSKKDSSNLNKSAYKLVQPGDIAYNKMRAWQGAIGVSALRGIISPAYVVMRLRNSDDLPTYFHHLYRTPQFAKEAERWSYGITSDMWSLRPEHFKMIYTPKPPPAEQAAIVCFIDHSSAKIERAIRAKKKLIAFLDEQKQSITHRAVTRGLDPNVPIRPSGTPWLGNIPQHWETRKIKFLVSITGGMTPNKSVERFWGGSMPWVTPKDMKVRRITHSRDHITESALRSTPIAIIQPPAVLIVVRGMILARKFPVAITSVPVTVNQDMKALIPRSAISADYMVSLLIGIQRELLRLVEIAGHGTCCLRTDSWENLALPIPPASEQEHITVFLQQELETINLAAARAEREIRLLHEYRTRLVADLVTGKLDVRAALTQLRDQAELKRHFLPDTESDVNLEAVLEEENL